MRPMPELTVYTEQVADLVPYANNAKLHPAKQIDEIANSIAEFGNCDPIAVWHNDEGAPEIVEGHGRVLALKQLGITEAPVIYLDHLTDEQRRVYTHVHNQTTLSSSFDYDTLTADMDNLNADWAAFGFEDYAYDEEAVIEDTPPEDAPEVCKRGEVWQLGEHRLMCGDATSTDDLEKLLDGDRPLFVFTDPPYGVAIGDKNKMLDEFDRGGRQQENIAGDTLTTGELHHLVAKAVANLKAHCSDECSYYVTAPQGADLGNMMDAMRAGGLPVRHNLIWVKNRATFSLGRLDYDYKHEPIFYTWGTRHTFYGDYNVSVIDDTTPIDRMSKEELKDLVRALKEERAESVVYCDKPQASRLHPTMKPVRLVGRLMQNSSRRGDIVCDVFGGGRHHDHSRRAVGTARPRYGNRPEVLRRHNKALGRVHRAEGREG